jgi:FkbM family methyltransferase
LYFSFGGKTIKDKILSYYLRAAMDNPFERRPNFVIKRIRNHGPIITLCHKYFTNFNLQYNLLDNFEMAICQEFFLQNVYDLNKLNFLPEIIVDCGAYRGYFSFLASVYFPKASINAIEAHPENFKKIKTAIEFNNITNINLKHGAICRSGNSFIDLFFEGSSGSMEDSFGHEREVVKVRSIDLEQFINQENLLLKVDIEGAELDFFPSIINKLPSTCAVFLETHDGWNSLAAIKDKFIEEGFSFEVIRERETFIDSFAQRKRPLIMK